MLVLCAGVTEIMPSPHIINLDGTKLLINLVDMPDAK